MKMFELFEEDSIPDVFIGKMLLKLYQAHKPLKVAIKDGYAVGNASLSIKSSPPYQIWDITKVEIHTSLGNNEFRIYNTSPGQWFELIKNDDENLTLKKMPEGYWLLTSINGKGVAL